MASAPFGYSGLQGADRTANFAAGLSLGRFLYRSFGEAEERLMTGARGAIAAFPSNIIEGQACTEPPVAKLGLFAFDVILTKSMIKGISPENSP